MTRIADDFDAIDARLREMRGCRPMVLTEADAVSITRATIAPLNWVTECHRELIAVIEALRPDTSSGAA